MRHQWEFQYNVARLLEASKLKQSFHDSKVATWQSLKEKVMSRIRESGIDVKESLAGAEYSNVARGFDSQIVVDATMQRDLNEASGKIREHGAKASDYKSWVEVFAAQPAEMTLDLDHDDFHFFFGK